MTSQGSTWPQPWGWFSRYTLAWTLVASNLAWKLAQLSLWVRSDPHCWMWLASCVSLAWAYVSMFWHLWYRQLKAITQWIKYNSPWKHLFSGRFQLQKMLWQDVLWLIYLSHRNVSKHVQIYVVRKCTINTTGLLQWWGCTTLTRPLMWFSLHGSRLL